MGETATEDNRQAFVIVFYFSEREEGAATAAGDQSHRRALSADNAGWRPGGDARILANPERKANHAQNYSCAAPFTGVIGNR
ncbi:hypothetical protein KAM644c_07630 [Klebsiella quasipneumoniae subsp. quasipneumoniae]|uniref:Uncharacterized protein n=1 Tax=Klebsiella quasipneumoniae subsp. quasipneumoniae TaxID=1667327 RepID=A0AAN1Y1J5_9ENTR|nr:hypothetical protein KAM622c_07710 [Klebsiella quasipneumoniae subsp. quasipneumoniae]BDO11697.1 hypothetical protein KAM644c_07630 [Klebsiella quasipneumoniae subsp. quasipneumoniae]GKP81359.1 hypothetical protein NUKP48_28860 [Klebsiella quasipneumoniae]GKQ12954.1 hypothetical protein NUKP108_14240 [Klebsiella quasipneumoniae]